MTKEEALRRVKGYLTDIIPAEDYSEVEEITKALEPEPCEDCISRKEVHRQINKWVASGESEKDLLSLHKRMDTLPPVTPQPKTGHWIAETDDYGEIQGWHCSECYEDSGFTTDCKWDFCSKCRAKMENAKDEISE